MELLANLEKGLNIIEPFLKRHDFGFKVYENYNGSGGRFTFVKYKNELKEFQLGYHFSIAHVVYQFDKLAVSHNVYLERLGFANKKRFQDPQTEDKLLAFKHILYDFEFLVDDFFKGECVRLKEIAGLQDNLITEYDKKAREGYNLEFDKLRIDKARQQFKEKDYRKSIEIYRSIEYKNLMNALDLKIIEFCERHV